MSVFFPFPEAEPTTPYLTCFDGFADAETEEEGSLGGAGADAEVADALAAARVRIMEEEAPPSTRFLFALPWYIESSLSIGVGLKKALTKK